MPVVKNGLRGHEVPAEPGTYTKVPLPLTEPDAIQRATLQGQRKKYRFKSRSTKYTILLESKPAHSVDGRLYEGSYLQVHFESDGGTPAFGIYETDDEKENGLLRKAKTYNTDFWDADERQRREEKVAFDKFVDVLADRPDLVRALLTRLKPNPDAKDFLPVLNPESQTPPTFTS